ncbi:6-bladed beta-propeller [Aliifodinibius salicampi]|uniref:6-bladed beta-propeller n=1 Tax=Fodinibius salicampi TaxID=1920655 RepID=A0ABT3PWM7_9BACT|nr:6-bladed beta-propeller [Fodinibius salicampi]MCW9712251.1 6-bladed beta-propeller [Fodinibius salicampi]
MTLKSRDISLIIALFIMVMGCSNQSEKQVPDHIKKLDNLTVNSIPQNPDTVTLVQDQVFGSTNTTVVGNMVDVAVDTNGKVYIADGDQNIIHSYQQDGSYLTSLGKEGDGPGEFRNIGNINIVSDQLYAHARQSQIINIYSLLSQEYMAQIDLNPRNWKNIEDPAGVNSVSTFYPLSDDRFLVAINEFKNPENQFLKYYWINSDGKMISEKLLEQKKAAPTRIKGQTPIVFTLPFAIKPLLAFSSEGNLYSARTDEFLIKLHDRAGDYQEAFYYPYERSPLNKEELISRYPKGSFRQGVSKVDFPETWPVMEQMLIDDEDHLWISTIVDDMEIYQWWVLSEHGELLARFKWPRNKEIKVVKNGYLYALETLDETEEQQVVRYRVNISSR